MSPLTGTDAARIHPGTAHRPPKPRRRLSPGGHPTDGTGRSSGAAWAAPGLPQWSTAGRPSSAHSVMAQLNREWEYIRREAAGWVPGSPTLETVLDGVRPDPDRALSDLITACQEGHQRAGRVVIQALAPKLVLMSCAYPYPGLDDLVAALWIRLARFPLGRRPGSVAANLLLDARKDVVAENRSAALPPVAMTSPSLTARSVINTARQLNLATPQSLAIMEQVYVDGLPTYQVATLHDITADAVRRRCSDAVHHLRAHRDLLADLALA